MCCLGLSIFHGLGSTIITSAPLRKPGSLGIIKTKALSRGYGITETKSISPFWYRRTCEITLLISLVILALYAVSLFVVGKQTGDNGFFVPLPAVILAALTAASSLASYIWSPYAYMYWLAFGNYMLLGFTTAMLIALTGQADSPYIALWMLLSIFAGLFGLWGLALIFFVTNAALAYMVLTHATPLTPDHLAIFFLASEIPLLISYLIWHGKGAQESNKTKAFDALAKQLSQVASKSEIVINAIADGVVAIDSQGIVQLVNPAAQTLLGWEKDDALGLDYRSVIKLGTVKGKELADTASPIQQVLITNKPVINNDIVLTTRSSKKVFISLVVSPVSNGKGPAAGAIAVFRDITREKEQERAKAEFISTASHEMRTPVAAIEGYLSLALNPATATIDDKAHSYLLKAHESTQHLGRLFQDLLTVSRAEDGRLATKPSVIDVVAFAREITESLAQKAQAKGLFLYFKPGGGGGEEGTHTIPPIFYAFADADQMREVLGNLIDNAIKYTRRGNVTIDVTGDDKNVTLSVTDTGIGIPPEDITHLFQKFYRIDNSDTREIGGTGLGLYICRRLAEVNNGRVWAESAYGKGSTFYLQIPRITHEQAHDLKASSEKTA